MGQERSTFKHAAIYSFAAMLGKVIGFLMLPFYAHLLRGIGYGIIGMIDAGLGFLTGLLASGLTGAIVRFYHQEDGEDKKQVISTGIWLIAVVSVILVGLTALFSRPISGLLLGDSAHWDLICLALGCFLFDLVGKSASAILIIERRSIPFSIIGLIRLIIGLSLNIYLIIFLKMGVLGYFLSSFFTAIVPACLFLTISIRKCGLGFDRRIAREIIAFQLPLIPGCLAAFVSKQIERVLVRFMIAIESVGVLEMGYKFPALLNLLITYPFFRSWDTKRIEIAEADAPDARIKIGRMFTYSLFLLIFSGLIMAVAIKDVLQILTPPEFWDAYRIARVEILTIIMFGTTFHVNFGLFYTKDTKTWSLILGITSAIKIGLSFLFIHLWGLYGAAYSACVVEFIRMVWAGWQGLRRYRFNIEARKIAFMVLVATGVFLALSNLNLSDAGFIVNLEQNQLPSLLEALDGTFLGTWKDGKALTLLAEKGNLILCLFFRVLFSLGFGLFFFPVHQSGTEWLNAWAARIFRG